MCVSNKVEKDPSFAQSSDFISFISTCCFQSAANFEQSSLNANAKKSYGAIKPEIDSESLTYTWFNVDVFGAVQQQGFTWPIIKNRIKNAFCNERHIPTARKHLLKNGNIFTNHLT